MTEFAKLGFVDGEYRNVQNISVEFIRESVNSAGVPGWELKKIVDQFSNAIIQHYIQQYRV